MDNCLIVLNYNDYETTTDFIKMATDCSAISKIIVVDNCSSDDSFEVLKKLKNERIEVIQTEKNGGYAYGNNYGIKYALKKYNPNYIFISNPDVQFRNDVVINMQEALEKKENIGVVAPIVNQGYNIWEIPGFLGVIESVFLVIHNIHKRKIKKRLLKSSENIIEVGVVEGSFWCVKKEAYYKAGGLDERTFLYYEENIFSKRLENAGYTEAVLVKDRYNHNHSVSIKKRYGGKARVFKHFRTGMLIYLNDYLLCNRFQKVLFEIAFFIGFVERIIFDLVTAVIGIFR